MKDERYKETGKLLERLKKEVDESYSISVQLDMEDLTQAGYKYTRPRAGDYIMAINETIGFREKIRIVSYESSYDVTGRLLSHKVTCNDIGTVQKAITSEGSIMRSVSESKEYAEGALEVATRALVSANGKNTNYYGTTKPKDEPRGTLHEGDLLYLTVGEETELYYWSGTEWLPKILKVDTRKIETLISNAQTATNKAIEQANAKAQEALTKAGTIPDTSKLSDQIKQQILSSQDLQNKVTEGIKSVDGDTIYNKIYRNIEQSFAPNAYADYLNNKLSDTRGQVNDLDHRIASQTVEFNKLTESNKLYERIIGTSETDAPDKLSRLVMSSQIFQTEVGKYSTSGGPNMIRNSRADEGLKYWNGAPNKFKFLNHEFYMSGQKRMFLLYNGAVVNSPRFIFKKNTDYMLNMLAFDANTARFTVELRKRKKNSANQDYDEIQTIFDKTGTPAFDSTKAVKKSFKFNTGDFDNGYLLFSYEGNPTGWSGLFMTELDFYEGSSDRLWQPSPDDSLVPLEAVKTQVTQLAGSWSVRNLNSAGDVLGQLNLNPDGSFKINEGLISIGDKTYIKDGVIKSSMIGNAQIGTAHIGEIDASTARLINVSAKNITADGLTANVIKGGKLSSLNGITDFDLQEGWIDINSQAVGIRNRFEGKAMQFLIFGQGSLNGVPCAYTQLMSNRNHVTGIEHTSAGIQIWNGRQGGNVQTSITFYGKTMDFLPSSLGGGVSLNTESRKLFGMDDIVIKGSSLSIILDEIFDNFRNLNGVPGNYSRGYYPNWR